jgi:hypothetical protein
MGRVGHSTLPVIDIQYLFIFVKALAMAPPFSLLSANWIPVKRAGGSRDPIAPHEITSDLDSNPIGSFAWPRPDFA